MRAALLSAALALIPTAVPAQDGTNDRGILTAFLEDNLSGAGREVRIEGFAGALSSRATFDTLTIADAQGVWITIHDGAIQWNRSALFSGRVEVSELSAREVAMPRLPGAGEGSVTAAGGFSLPELPVSVRVGTIRADRIDFGAPVLGEPVSATVSGSLSLEAGEGRGELDLQRTDRKTAAIQVSAAYSNASGTASVDLIAREGADGIAARLAGIPGRPELTLALAGSGPLKAFRATMSLTSGTGAGLAGEFATSETDGVRTFSVDVSGNVAPLFVPDYRDFLGDDLRLVATGSRAVTGAVELTALNLSGESVRLDGRLRLRSDGLPEVVDLAFDIGAPEAPPVLLPLPGRPTRVQSATLRLGFDSAAGDTWRASGTLKGVEREDVEMAAASLSGSGRIKAGAAGPDSVGGTIQFGAGGIDFADPGLADALGRQLVGSVTFFRQQGEDLRLPEIEIAGDGVSLRGGVSIGGLADALTLTGNVEATYRDLGRLSRLAGRPLAGTATLRAEGRGSILSGEFDIEAQVDGTDIAVGQREIDTLLHGVSSVSASVRRDTAGTEIRSARIRAATLSADLYGRIAPDSEDLRAGLSFSDLSALGGRYGGTLSAEARLQGTGGRRQLTLDGTGTGLRVGLAAADRLLSGTSSLGLTVIQEGGTVSIQQGNVQNSQIRLSARGRIDGRRGAVDLDGRLADLGLFAPDFPGPVVARGRIGIDAERLSIGLDASGPGGTAGRIAGTASTRDGKVDLALTGRTQAAALDTFIAPRSLSGPVTFDLALRGTPSLRSMSGRVSADAIDFADPDYRVSVTGISFDADIANSQARIRSAGQVRGGGTVGIEGTVGLGAAEAADLTVALESVRLRDPSLYETRVSGQFRFTGAPAGGGLLSGEVAVGETELRIPSAGLGALGFDADILHVADSAPVRETRRRAGIGTAVPETPGAASRRPVALDIGISAPRRIFVRGRGLDAELGGSLRVRGTSADVQPAGQFDLIRGRLDILGKRFEIDEGLVRLEGALTPYVRFAANSTNDGVTSTVTIEGPASQPVIAFTSSPPLPEEEVVAQLLFGRGLDGISAFQAAQLASAIATLSGRGGEGVVGRLRSSFGLDDLDVQTDTDGNIAVRAGKYISQNVYTDIAVGTDGTSEINLNLDLNAGLTVRGTLGSDGDTGIGIYYERDY